MDGLTLLVLIAIAGLIWLTTYALCRVAAEGDEAMERERTGQRLAMQNGAFCWPERSDG